MELQSFQIHGFGHFVNAGIEHMPSGLTVICAENGGGKTTLRDFLRAGLFGFTREDRNRYLVDAPHSHGGAIHFSLRSGASYQLMFDAKKNKSFVKASNGQACPELGMLLGSASPQLYRNVFAIGLHELQDARHLDDEKVQTMIGAFGSGQSGQVFQAARSGLFREMEERFKPGGSNPRANKLMADLKALQDEQKRLKAEAENYWEYEQQLSELQEQGALAAETEKEVRARHDHLRTLAQAWPDWISLNGLKAQLAGLEPVVESFPAEGATKLESLNERLAKLSEDLKSRTSELERSRQDLATLVVQQEILDASTEIDEVCERFAVYEQNSESVRKAGDELKLISAKQVAEMTKLGAGWDAARLAAFSDDVASQAERAEAARQLRESESALGARKAAHERLTQDCSARKDAAAEARAALTDKWPTAPAPQRELDERLLALNNVRAKLAELARLADRKEQFERELLAANAEVDGLQQKVAAPLADAAVPVVSFPLRTAGWVLLAAGLAVAGLLYQYPLAAVVAFSIGIAGFVFCWRFRLAPPEPVRGAHHNAWFESQLASWQGRAAAAQQALAENERQSATAGAEVATLCQVFGRTLTDADCTDLQGKLLKAGEVRRQFEQHEAEVLAQEEACRKSEAELRSSSAELSDATSHHEAAQGRWTGWLRAHSLTETLTPEGADAMCRQIGVAQGLSHELQAQSDAIAHLQRQIEEYLSAVAHVFALVKRPVPVNAELGAGLRRLREERDAARENARQRDIFNRNLPDLETAVELAAAELNKCNAEKQGLLQAGAASDDEEFLARATAWRHREELLAGQRTHLGRLEVLSGPGAAVQRLQEELADLDWESLESRRAAAEIELAEVSGRLQQLSQQRGQIDEACSRLAKSDDVAACNAKIESAAAELNDLAEEWAVRKLAHLLMGRARDKFEIERQPAVLQSASASLATMTAGRVTRIIKPLEGGKYRLALANGETLGDDQTWNTAMKEQTYLSLRFGLIDGYCEQSEPLPIILDDALVNLDPRHLQGAVNCIGELAKRHQVIYLTCHPHTMECFAALENKPSFFRIRDREFHAAPHEEFVRA